MLEKIGLAAVVILVALTAVIAMQPDTYKVVHTAEIAAPPAAVFALINDFHKWDGWSRWAKIDPAMKTTYSGADSGVGASMPSHCEGRRES